MLPFQLNLLVFFRITALSRANPVPLEGLSSVEQFTSVSSLSPTDDSISSSSTADLIPSSNHNFVSNTNDASPGLLTTAGDSSSWVDGTSSPQQQQSQDIASCGGAPNRKRAEAGQQLNGAGGGGGGGGEANVCHAPLDNTAPLNPSGTTEQTETEGKGKKKKEPDEFYDGGGPRRGPIQIFPTDQDVELQNDMQAAKNRKLQLDDPARCSFAPFFVHVCCNGDLGPPKSDAFRGVYYQFVGLCILLNPDDVCTRLRDLCCEYFRPQYENGEGDGWTCIVKGEPRLKPDAVFPSISPGQF